MKKIFVVFAVSACALIACQKEIDKNENNKPTITTENIIPTEIVCEIDQNDTKTVYDSNTTFGWRNGDRVCMSLKNGDGSVGFSSFKTVCETGSVLANFTRTAGNLEDLESYIPQDATNLNYLIYPTSIFQFGGWQTDGIWNSGDFPVVNLPISYTFNSETPLNSGFDTTIGVPVPMIGRKVGNNYRFATAIGILKVTISNIPANISEVKLVSSDKCISGKFALSHSSEFYYGSEVSIAQIENTSDHNSQGTKSISLTTSGLTEGETYDFYFPVPIGTYSANTLSLKIVSKNAETKNVVSKIITKDINIARNEVLALPNLVMNYPNSISVASSGTSAPKLKFTTAKCLRFTIRSSAENAIDDYHEDMKFSNGVTNATYGLVSAKSATSDTPISAPGTYYLHYMILSTTDSLQNLSLTSLDDNRIIEYGTVPFTFVLSLSDILGTYTNGNNTPMPVVNWATGYYVNMTVVLADIDENDTDAPSEANVKITNIGGVLGKAYGTFDGNSTITFAIGQIYNTFESIEVDDKTYDRNSFLGLTGYTWYAPSFTVGRNRLESKQTYIVLRNTNETLWSADHTEGRGNPYGGGKWSGYVNNTSVPFALKKTN